jgi:tetratricopeptide (TPR) repeat protein
VNERAQANGDQCTSSPPVFVSYASANRTKALSVCKAIEKRGIQCWISTRDVGPGENYQEAIVRSLRSAPAMVLVFSEAANNSDEIKKELSLASRYRIPVMALRIEDVEPSDAFAYELSTRQWIDAFAGWDDSLAALVDKLHKVSGLQSESLRAPRPMAAQRSIVRRRRAVVLGAILLAVALGGGLWFLMYPRAVAAHSLQVRFTGFKRLSPNLAPALSDAMREEMIAAFVDEGVVGVSTAAAPPSGSAPAYTLGGTIAGDGHKVKVIVVLSNERSGATLASETFSYDADQMARIARHVAVDAGRRVRCGLFAASTYPKDLSDDVLRDYMHFCDSVGTDPPKALDFAQKVVAELRNFSWGWSAVEIAASNAIESDPGNPQVQHWLRLGLAAADKAIALDGSNSEALAYKAILGHPRDIVAQEKLFKQALAARALACGCEHHLYGQMLHNVGRVAEAAAEFRRSTDVIALNENSQQSLANSLLALGKPDEAKPHLDALSDLDSSPTASDEVAIVEAPFTGNYKAAVQALANPSVQLPTATKAALAVAYQAIISGDAKAKARAVQLLAAIPASEYPRTRVAAVGALGDTGEALREVLAASRRFDAPSWLFMPSMGDVLSDPRFPAVAERLGLMRYWKTTHIKPDVCSTTHAPHFCGMI